MSGQLNAAHPVWHLDADIPARGVHSITQADRGRPALYNDVVGCVEVHTIFTQLRADYRFTDKKRILHGSRHRGIIRHVGKLIEPDYAMCGLSSFEIFRDFRQRLLDAVNRTARLKERHLNVEAFNRCGPCIDWRSLLKLAPLGD